MSLVQHPRGCRCTDCKAARAQYAREWRASQTPEGRPHGDYQTYVNYGCRCEECRAAMSTYRADLRVRTNRAAILGE